MANPARLKLKFSNDTIRDERRRSSLENLCLDFTDRWGPGAIIDLAWLGSRPGLARALALALSGLCEPDGTIRRLATVKSYVRIIKGYFWPFISSYEAEGHVLLTESQDVKTFILQRFMDWLIARDIKLRTAYANYTLTVRLFRYLKREYPELIDPNLEIPTFPSHGIDNSINHHEPYSAREVSEIEGAARNEIRQIILRQKQCDELISKGRDPREEGWKDKANIVWYVKNELGGRYLSDRELKEAGHDRLCYAFNHMNPCTRNEIYGYLYPLIPDLIPAIILICLKTGLNAQPLIDLHRDCLKSVPAPGKVGIAYTKHRPGPKAKSRQKIVDDRSLFGPGQVLRLFLKITEPCLPFLPEGERNYLWVGLQPSTPSDVSFRHFSNDPLSKEVRRFAARNHLVGDDGKPLQLRLVRLRATWLTRRYKHAGHLAAASKDAEHEKAQTTVGYINNRQTLAIHEQTIIDGLQDFHDNITGKILTQTHHDIVQVKTAADALGSTVERAESILLGEQDVFVAACKDFYNRPGGPANTPCDRPWACFTCKNACWTSRTLPRLIIFHDFIIDQRRLLTAEDWKAKFGLPFEIITRHILPAFPPDVVSQARVEAKAERPGLPILLQTV